MECFMDVYWGNKNLYIPAIYVGQEGVALDLCMRVPLSDISAFMDKWKDRDYENMSDEEVEQAESESPYSVDFNIVLALDGVRVKTTFGCSPVAREAGMRSRSRKAACDCRSFCDRCIGRERAGKKSAVDTSYQAITYTVEPDISAEDLTVQDCVKGDQPRRKGAGSKEAGSSVLASSVALVPMYAVEDGEEPKVRSAYSSLWFGPVDRVEFWRKG